MRRAVALALALLPALAAAQTLTLDAANPVVPVLPAAQTFAGPVAAAPASPPAAAQTLTDSVVTVPVPAGWSVWSEDDIRLANPDSGGGQTVVAQCGVYPFGYPDFNPTISLSQIAASPEADPSALVAQIIGQVPGFTADTQGVVPFAIGGVPCAAAAGRFSVALGANRVDVIMRAIVLSPPQGPRAVTTISPGAGGPWEDALTQLPREITVTTPPPPRVPMQRTNAVWKVGRHWLPLPGGFARWTPAQVEEARAQSDDAASSIIAGIQQQTPSPSGFHASVAAEIKVGIPPAEVPDAITLCSGSADAMFGTIPYGTWIARPTTFTIAGFPAAYAIIQGRFPQGSDYQTLEFQHVWVIIQGEPLRFLIVTEAGDLTVRATMEQMLNAMTP